MTFEIRGLSDFGNVLFPWTQVYYGQVQVCEDYEQGRPAFHLDTNDDVGSL